MKRILLFICVLMFAPIASRAQGPPKCMELKKVKIEGHVLRQMESTQAVLIFKVRNCEIIEERGQTSVIFESIPGLDVTVEDVVFRRQEGGNRVNEVRVTLKLTASPDLLIGETTLHGMLTYQAVRARIAAPTTVSLSIPLKVGLPLAKQPNQSNAFVNGLKIAGEVVVGIPLLLFMMVYCPISGQCPDC